jgi:hypothetical protein
VNENWYFGGGLSATTLSPLVALLMIATIVAIYRIHRKYAIVPFLLFTFLIPREEQVVIGGVHFFVLRIVIIVWWLRFFLKTMSLPKGLFGGRLGLFDQVFVVWALYRAFAFIAVFHFESGAVVNQLGALLDALGSYFILRYLIRDDDDILLSLKVLAVVVVLIAPCMLFEKLRGVNPFGYLGGPFQPEIREGAIRAQGPFAHAILAGTFGATLVPLFLWLWKSGKARYLSILGVISATVMTATSASSTPLMAYGAWIVAVCCWPIRRRMRLFRWGLVIGLIGLHLAMKAPVWFLIERVSIVGGSSGYHRAELVDQFIRRFGDWWLVGTSTTSGYGDHLWDLSNQFVAEGESGGLPTFICFIALISICFSRIGRARRIAKLVHKSEWYFWFLGAALFGHIVGFFGISYFDHVQIAWFALLIIIVSSTEQALRHDSANRQTRQHHPDREAVFSLTQDASQASQGAREPSLAELL